MCLFPLGSRSAGAGVPRRNHVEHSVVLPAILLGRAIDAALAFERGEVGAGDVGWACIGPWWGDTAHRRSSGSKRYLLQVLEREVAPRIEVNQKALLLHVRPSADRARKRAAVDS